MGYEHYRPDNFPGDWRRGWMVSGNLNQGGMDLACSAIKTARIIGRNNSSEDSPTALTSF